MTCAGTGWLRTFTSASPGAPRLVCFPHAGGTAEFFRPLARALAPDVEVLAVQYPGRQDRRREPTPTDLRGVARDLVDVLAPLRATGPLAFFGHSMGADVAFEAALATREPDVLIASGARAPSCPRPENVELASDQAIVDEIHLLGGTSPAVLADPDLRGMLLPIIRGDYRALRAYTYTRGARVGCPISVMVGTNDPRVTLADAERWRELTTGRFELRTFAGGHFYLTGQGAAVAAAVRAELSALV
ncbi:alpha/beta fold hydrolase [Kibdelosporangium lantanae]